MLPFDGALARSFWGKSWCQNLESYSDYSNRLGRGRSYVRNGAVVDLRIEEGRITSRVQGRRLYEVRVTIRPVATARWSALVSACHGDVSSIADLLSGALSPRVLKAMCEHDKGLFPEPREIEFTCSCPDWASMCKHVAATLYGVGARLDERPELLFVLRGADHHALVGEAAVATVNAATALPVGAKLLGDAAVADIFGITVEPALAPVSPSAPAPKPKRAKRTKPAKQEVVASAPLSGFEAAMRAAMASAFAPTPARPLTRR